MPPVLSIITPSLNQVAMLASCLDSIAELQPFVEHVVADGGSTDGSTDLLERHRRARPDRFSYISRPDRGIYQALNRGISQSSGELVGYVNCDDALLPWTPGLVQSYFERHPEVDLLVGDALELDGERAALVVQPPGKLLLKYLEAGFILPQPAVFFRRALFEKLGGFDESYELLGDHDFFTRALASGGQPGRLWEVLAVQRVVAGQLMQRFHEQAMREKAEITSERGWRAKKRETAVWRLLAAALHRGAIASVASGVEYGAWSKMTASGYLRHDSLPALASVFFQSSRRKRFLILSESARWMQL